ncbi:uncharacterized protein LOC129717042 [Wyeomyia smithii]|uniref:uncharacterized protein LOC129717042 n=1 Tax=Wyeomyia smithii TaxID=174621 RepID=UPI002467FEA5|nr:uncharacterized protein LOC129717042 [Wyeomyia smithii]
MAEESATALHGLVDEFERHTKVLKQLGEPTDAWSTMLEHLLCTRLHNETLRLWEDHASTLPDPTYTNLIEFLQRRIRVLESISVNCDAVQSISGSHTAPMVKHGPSDKNGKSSHLKMVAHAVQRNLIGLVTADLPERNISIADWNIPKDLFLADPTFNERGPFDMIIGFSHFFDCFRSPARIRIARDLSEMVDSVFGWIVAGSSDLIPASPETVQCNVTAICLTTLEESLERFWKVEELPSRDNYSAEERECENLYTSTVTRDHSGRNIVRLPRHPEFDSMLGESKAAALRRFKLLEQRLEREAEMKEEYHRFMREYISLGHMRLLGMNQHPYGNFYLPHHPVVKESSTTTKVRVVFDGSAKSTSGVSLNEALLTGPVVQDDLLSIVLQFRKFPVALVADIEKMYRQVLIHPEDTPYQRILWRFNESDPIQTYELLTVTYGLAPSSFLATRTLQQLADDEGTAYPLADPILRKNFYVDDCLGGAQSVDEALQLRHELTELLSKGGLTLRKWTSNKLEVLQGLSSEQIGTQSSFVFAPHESVKALRIGWEPETDELRFESKILFDPLGLIAPVVIRGKMFMQELWLAHCDWDQPVPNAIQEKWKTYHHDLAGIAEYRIDRYAFLPNAKVQLHTFSDASESAYGACLRAIYRHAWLELCAAEIASQLYAHVKTALQLEISDARFWSDSTVTIQWLQAPSRTWKTFVANRVSKIQTLTHGYRWTHIPGKDNPADLVSRGMAVGEFVSSELWKYGPTWLRLPEGKWPAPLPLHEPVDNIEARKVVATMVRAKPAVNSIFLRYSSFTLLVRVTAHCLQFIRLTRLKARTNPQSRPGTSQLLSVTQLEEAKVRLIQIAQADEFSQEIKELQAQKPLHKQSQIRALNPFIDQQGTIRVGERLRLSDQPYSYKHPSLLPSFHPLSKSIAKFYHLKLLHGGGQLTLAAMRETYWPVRGKRLVRSVIRNCLPCLRANPVPAQQRTGQLPIPRVTPSRPFTVTGVDYAGPVYLRPPHKRASPTKAYICIFVCFSTKAVHIVDSSDACCFWPFGALLQIVSFLQGIFSYRLERRFACGVYNKIQGIFQPWQRNRSAFYCCCFTWRRESGGVNPLRYDELPLIGVR